MSVLTAQKQCINGKNCMHLKNTGDGMLPYHAFNDNGEGRGTTRPECRVCTSFRYSSQEGARAKISSRFDGDFKAGLKALHAKKKKSLDPFEAAVLLGVSESQVGNLVEAGLLKPSVKDGGNYDKADVLALNERPEELAYYRFRSSWEHWNSHNRVNLSDKIPKWAKVSEGSQLTFIGDQTEAHSQPNETLETDGWLGVAHAYRNGVDDLLKRIAPMRRHLVKHRWTISNFLHQICTPQSWFTTIFSSGSLANRMRT